MLSTHTRYVLAQWGSLRLQGYQAVVFWGWGGMEKCRKVNGGKGGLLTILGLGLGFHFVLALRPSPIQSQICVHVSLHTFFFPLVKSPAFFFFDFRMWKRKELQK